MSLEQQFTDLHRVTSQLISLLDEADEKFWIRYLRRALPMIESHKLAGATHVLGCYGGVDTFSDLTIGDQWRESDPLRHRNLNARLMSQRTETFEAARRIASRESW